MKILCVTDIEGRVQYRRMAMLQNYMKKHQLIVVHSNRPIKFRKYPLVYYSNYSIYDSKPCDRQIPKICSITSHRCLKDKNRTLKKLAEFQGVSVNNMILYNAFRNDLDNIFYTPNGVHTNVFVPPPQYPKNEKLVIGWVGNKDRAVKRYREIFKPLKKQYEDKYNFEIIGTRKSDSADDIYTTEEMVSYYQKLDVLLVTSDNEGTPNPALEAMSCGVPVITTRVGNMPEIIINGKNGIFVDKNVDSFGAAISEFAEKSSDERFAMREMARQLILPWDWDNKAEAWVDFLEGFAV